MACPGRAVGAFGAAEGTLQVLPSSGALTDAEPAAFQAAGHTRRDALEVVLGIGAYTRSTFANRLTRAAWTRAVSAPTGASGR